MKASAIILIWGIILFLVLAGCTEHEASPLLTATALPSSPILSSTPTPTPYISPSATPVYYPSPSPSTPEQFPPGTDLQWESIGMRAYVSGAPDLLNSYPFYVMISPPYLPMEGFTDSEKAAVKAVDFNQYFVLIVIHDIHYPFSGGPYKKFQIERIWSDSKTVYVLAALPPIHNEPTTPDVREAFQIVKIDKDGINTLDRVAFKLFDDWGNNRGEISSLIPRQIN